MSQENRQWLLKSRPAGMVKESDFELVSTPMPTAGEGQLLIRNRILTMEPAMRGWIDDKPNYLPPVPVGGVMRGMSAGEVIESNLEGYSKGDLVSAMLGWQEFAIGDASARPIPAGVDPKLALSVLGATGVTAYFCKITNRSRIRHVLCLRTILLLSPILSHFVAFLVGARFAEKTSRGAPQRYGRFIKNWPV